uniref:Dynein axonemal assembly factor 3 homolog n=1 Tax=Chlamydomonas reinhardtii TaxID=3055 RepID=DAAF3_CHLRE|nr:RecName: Full=Dynein axonemal assembly factor 3 homolog; AltName: Full=Dynein assembly blocked protein 1; AltName: Full=Paralyzed flagella protein 22 [Chlamydomonas reinhardtii]AEC04845.1 axonemal dynein assembly protein PF22 [Chlamydomonas reinhardtii]
MDEHNVHHFWGISPAVDLGTLLPTGDGAADLPVDQPVRFLQVAPYDARHTLTTLSRACRHPALMRQLPPGQPACRLYVWEDSPEGLARHVLLAAVLLDGGVPAAQRGQLLLELHGNAVLRRRAAEYLDEKARQLESLFVGLAAGQPPPAGPEAEARGLAALAALLDLSLLKFQEKDLIVEALQRWRLPNPTSSTSTSAASASAAAAPYDMVAAWDGRCRKVYGERYDFRRNMVDWDYHMRLQPAGTPGCDPASGSIIHFHHFRHWRLHGVAHELRDSAYNSANRCRGEGGVGEFKDRTGRDVGRSVSAWGFWADVLNSPYHAFGTACEQPEFYRITNKQFVRTAVDVAEHNIAALLHELRTGRRLELGEGQEAHRAQAARGPTTLEDLTAAAEEAAAAASGAGAEAGAGAGPGGEAAAGASSSSGKEEAAAAAAAGKEQGQGEGQGEDWTAGSGSGAPGAGTGQAVAEGREGPGGPQDSDPAAAASTAAPAAAAAAASSSSTSVPTYSSGGRAQVAKAMAAAAAAAGAGAGAGAEASSSGAASAASAAPTAGASSGAADGKAAEAAAAPLDEAAREQMAAEEAAVRAAEAALDAAARQRAGRFRLVLVTGDLAKTLTGRAKYAGAFSGLSLGHRHTHMLEPQYKLAAAAAPGARLVAENARHVLQLSQEQAALFAAKMDELAAAGGWRPLPAAQRPPGITEAAAVYVRAA